MPMQRDAELEPLGEDEDVIGRIVVHGSDGLQARALVTSSARPEATAADGGDAAAGPMKKSLPSGAGRDDAGECRGTGRVQGRRRGGVLDDERGDHPEHAVLALGVLEDVAVERPGARAPCTR